MARPSSDLRGQRFGRLEAMAQADAGTGRARWLCRCDCGRTRVARADNLVGGRTTSCGCSRRRERIVMHDSCVVAARFRREALDDLTAALNGWRS